MATAQGQLVDYLVGGLRISVHDASATPGPRSHILNVVRAFRSHGYRVNVHFTNSAPGLARLRNAPEGAGVAESPGILRRCAIDAVRLSAAVWGGIWLRMKMDPHAQVIYERVAVLQNLTAFHPNRKRAFKIAESNGLMSRETANDRNALILLRLAESWERSVYKRADLVIAVSAPLKQAIVEFASIPQEKVLVVPNAVPDDLTRVEVRRNSEFVIGFVGAVVPWQRVETLLTGFAQSNSREKGRIVIVGGGSAVATLQTVARDLGISKSVDFRGKLNREETIEEMRKWAVGYAGHVASTSAEMYHSPLKIYEYVALGMSVIATDYGDSRELQKDGAAVHIVEDAGQVSEAIDAAYGDWHEERIPAGATGARLATGHSWRARVSLIQDTIDKHSSRNLGMTP